jgi:hypothetical protein
MECNRDEAQRAKDIAKKKFEAKDLQGAKKFALKAQALFPDLEGIAQMIATFEIYLASEVKVAGEKDWYSILSVTTAADDEMIKKQYRKLVLLLHPDKNKQVGAEGAFQIVKEAYTVLSDKTKRAVYDQKRNVRAFQQRTTQSSKASVAPGASNGFYKFAANAAAVSKPTEKKQTAGPATPAMHPRPSQPPPPSAPSPAPSSSTPAPGAKASTFWTSCNKCKMNYEYLRVYLNHHLRCPSCREPFLAKEVPIPPTETVVHDSNISGANKNASTKRNMQWGPFSRAAGAASATASSAAAARAANAVHQTYEKVRREREEAQAAARREGALRRKYNPLKRHGSMSENINHGTGDVASGKKMRTKDSGVGSSSVIPGPGANCFRVPGANISFSTNNGVYEFQGINSGPNWKTRPPMHISLAKTFSQLDVRGLLLEKAKSDTRNKLTEIIKSKTSKVAASEKANKKDVVKGNGGDNEALASDDPTTIKDVHADPKEICSNMSSDAENEDDDPLSYNVPDPDFHDFDKDRAEESFQSDQIWATYDDEDGMPRYYAFIQKVLSLKPFKIRMCYLESKTNSEFGPLNWVSSGFTKTCGDFRTGKSETCDIVNMFSHQMKWEKGLRGVIKIYPQKGDIWAIYRNWSPDWDEDTPDGERHQDLNATMKIPKEEMFRFSHQVPFYRMSGEEAPNVPKDSYELDPAAISKELLQGTTETVEANGTS